MKSLKPVIVKLGGSVITDKGKSFSVKLSALKRLARELATFNGPLIVVHGGGSFGHPVASKYKIAEGYRDKGQLMGFSLTHRAMERLNSHVIDAFQEAGIPAISIQPSACAVVSGGRIKSMEIEPLKKLLSLGLVPVLYGDAVPDRRMGMSIISGDQIVVHLVKELGASRVIIGVDVDGVYATNPKKDGEAALVKKITPTNVKLIASADAAGVKDVTGGMRKKVEELMKLTALGIEAEIVNAAKPNIIKDAIHGKRGLGTIVSGRQ